jgi:hypothetical protein
VKLNNTYVLLNSGNVAERVGWAQAHKAISDSVKSMRWPNRKGVRKFRIPRIVSIPVGSRYTDSQGHTREVKDKKKTLRNGVRPLRDQFRTWMAKKKWRHEKPLSLVPFFGELRGRNAVVFPKYPQTNQVEEIQLNESVGDFDFWFMTKSGFRTVVEWETGNISSSHRSLNKMCLALMGGLVDTAVLIVPSRMLYPHLTDRIGNIRELQPYFYFWNRFGTMVNEGLLVVIEVEHDELFKSTDLREFVSLGTDGNSMRGSSEEGQSTDDFL